MTTNPSASLDTILDNWAVSYFKLLKNADYGDQVLIKRRRDKAKQALHSALLSRMPEEKDWSKDPADEWENASWVGYNQALTDITQVLNDFFKGSK